MFVHGIKLLTHFSLLCSVEGGRDLGFRFTHTDGNFNKGVGDGFVVSELHKLWSHWNTELLGHSGDFVEVWLSTEGGGKSV